uniref:NucA/NucB deoxyribonuclease domain-containing protein n=1 Tax=Streptomyces mirabilis TaxID=68239 RepID=UPI0036F24445
MCRIQGGAGGAGMLRVVRIDSDATLRRQNRDTARAVCQAKWPNYSAGGKDCDEYPFSTTKEGAKNANGNYSARALDSTDNPKAGSRLATWYNDDRILDGDAFYAKVNQPPHGASRRQLDHEAFEEPVGLQFLLRVLFLWARPDTHPIGSGRGEGVLVPGRFPHQVDQLDPPGLE